jgi:PAS domain S-box-containing protein
VDRTLNRTDHFSAEFRVVWPDGTAHWLYGKGQVFRDSQGNLIRMIGVNMDISERKRSEASLRESEERFRNMADTAPVMIWASGKDKLCTFFNTRWLIFTGRTMEQELGNGWAEGVHPADLDLCVATYFSSFDARRSFQMEYRLRRADGEYRWVLDNGVPRVEPGGVFAGYIGSCIDITELRRTQGETLARQKLESVGVLAGGIAHDFNNLLGGILAEAELATTELAAGVSPNEGIQRIAAVASRGAEIVRELMIYAGRDKADPIEPVDVPELVEEMLTLLKISISKHAVLKTNLRQDLPAALGRPSQIRQIVMNLIINASEAIGDNGGTITVTISRGPNSPPHLPSGGYLSLEVSDTGCGMTEEVQGKVFDPFFTTKFAGRGLGLAVVQGIVRDHGGAISLSSAPGQGTAFEILLPCAREPVSQQRAAAIASSARNPKAAGTVLLVEDEDVLRLAVSKMLRKNGFSVIEAKDGSAAIDLICGQNDDIGVILLDVTLPGRSSREVIQESQRIRPDIKIVLTSAYGREMVVPSLAAPQVTGFIRKPFRLADLVQLLRETLST